jgi:hypothetical protein
MVEQKGVQMNETVQPLEKGREYKRVSEASDIFIKKYTGVPLEPELLDLFAKLWKAVPREFIINSQGCRCGNDWCPLNMASVIADRFLPPLKDESEEKLEEQKD